MINHDRYALRHDTMIFETLNSWGGRNLPIIKPELLQITTLLIIFLIFLQITIINDDSLPSIPLRRSLYIPVLLTNQQLQTSSRPVL